MNKIQTTKANSTLRRFFDRLGGGNVKALGYNKTVSVDGNGGGEEGGGDITVGQAWMKTFNGFKTFDCSVPPVKVLKNWDVRYSDTQAPAINFIENYDRNCYEPYEDAVIYNIEDLPDSIYEESNMWFLLYKLEDLNGELSNGSVNIYTHTYLSGGTIDFMRNGQSLNKWNTQIILIDGEYYVVYNDNLD